MPIGRRMDILEYLRRDGTNPFRRWLDDLDVTTRARIQARVSRFETGNLGDCKSVGGGVIEARCDFGPGYRVYLARDGGRVIVLLLGGRKNSQPRDIRMARQYWEDYQERIDEPSQ